MAQRSQRSATRSEFAAKLRDRLPDVGVDEFFPGKNMKAEHVWCQQVLGIPQEDAFLMADRKHRWDNFTMLWVVQTTIGGKSILEQSERCDDIAEEIVTLVVEDADASSFDAEICSLFIAEDEGPNPFMLGQGPACIREITVEVRSHLT